MAVTGNIKHTVFLSADDSPVTLAMVVMISQSFYYLGNFPKFPKVWVFQSFPNFDKINNVKQCLIFYNKLP